MTLNISVVLTTLALSCLPQLANAQGNLVFNGSFDTDASGWIVSPGSSSVYLSTLGNPAGCFLLYSSSSSNYPMISQTINGLVYGSSYLISGDYILSKGQAGNTPSFGVAIDDIFLFEGVNPSGLNWSHFSFDYIATSPSVVLSLSAQINGTDVSYGIDNISMEAVPEPNSLWLIGIGGIASATFLINRRKGLSRI
jgi:hypothetical protein